MLKDVATVQMGPNAERRRRACGESRRIDVGANVEGRPLNQVVDDVEQRMEGVTFPLGYHAEVIGESTSSTPQKTRCSPLASRLAWRSCCCCTSHSAASGPLYPVLLLPMALVGGAIAVWMSGRGALLGSLVGFLAVFGIARQRDHDDQPLRATGA